MTRGRDSTEKAADVAAHSGRAVLVELNFDSGVLRFAIAAQNITVGADTYVATNAAFRMSPVEEATAGFEGFELSLSGLDAAIVAIMEAEPYRGRVVRVLEPRFDANDAQVGTARVQMVGRMRAMGSSDQLANGSVTVTLAAEHYDAEFEQPQPWRFTDADQQRRHPGDLGGEYLSSLIDRVVARNR